MIYAMEEQCLIFTMSIPQEPPSKKLAGMFKALEDSDIEGTYVHVNCTVTMNIRSYALIRRF